MTGDETPRISATAAKRAAQAHLNRDAPGLVAVRASRIVPYGVWLVDYRAAEARDARSCRRTRTSDVDERLRHVLGRDGGPRRPVKQKLMGCLHPSVGQRE